MNDVRDRQILQRDQDYENISKKIAKKIDKEWLKTLHTEDDILKACVELCSK